MRKISVSIQQTNNPAILKFESNTFLTQYQSFEFDNIDDAKDSAIAQQLFYLPFVKKIYISGNCIAIEHYDIVNWADVQEEVREQIENYLNDGGSFTLMTGVLARDPIPSGSVAALANGAIESFTLAAAIDLPRGLRINTVSPNVLIEATSYHPSFPGYHQVSAQSVADAYVKSILGKQTGQIYKLD